MITLGMRIRMLRTYRQMTQSELAHGICSPSAISQMEADKISPSTETMLLLAERLQFPAEKLIYGEDYTAIEEAASLAVDLMEKRHFGEAIVLFESIMESNVFNQFSTRKHILYNLACCYMEQFQYDEAITLLEEITRDKSPHGFYTDEILLCDSYRALAKCHQERSLNKAYMRVYGDQASEILHAKLAPPVRPVLRLIKGGD